MGSISKRIEWIDTAKGICILLVVFNHAAEYFDTTHPFTMEMRTFRMPLYYILSGLFFKTYENFYGFLKRKVNKLVIPFIFFFIITSLIPALIKGHPIKLIIDISINSGPLYNYAIWFLLSLFEVNIIFYLLFPILKNKPNLGYVITLLLGVSGLIFSYLDINLPIFFDTSLSAFPFFIFGFYIGRKTSFLTSPFNYKFDIFLIILSIAFILFFAAPLDYSTNSFSDKAYWICYPCGIFGTIMVLLISKLCGKVYLLSYWGRYSIIILCTHMVVLGGLKLFFSMIGISNAFSADLLMYIIFIATMLLELLIIPFCLRFLPHFTAQKDVIQINSK